MNFRYFLVGLLITAGLVGGIFIVRKQFRPIPREAEVAVFEKLKGERSAPVQIVEYSDFECPACAKAQADLNRLMADYSGKVAIQFRHYPLPGHRVSPLAHQAAECANAQGRFWDYHDRLYAEQQQWTILADPAEMFLRYGRVLGLNLDAFARCLVDPAIGRKIQAEKRQGDRVQVTATPTFLMNGTRIVGPKELEMNGEAVIRRLLGLPPKTKAGST